jgi:hypothetical protein
MVGGGGKVRSNRIGLMQIESQLKPLQDLLQQELRNKRVAEIKLQDLEQQLVECKKSRAKMFNSLCLHC